MAPAMIYTDKFSSLFSKPKSASQSRPTSCLFLKLPYDIRVIIYSYMDTEPPLSPRIDGFGFYQSCRQVKQDLDEIVYKKIQSLCTVIEGRPDVNLAIKFDPTSPRYITITLPYSAFNVQSTVFRDPTWNREILSALQPLFALHFNVFRIHITQQNCTSSAIPKHNTLREKLELQDTMRHLLFLIGSMIDHQNHYWTGQSPRGYDTNLHVVFGDQPYERMPPFPPSFVLAQRICLSWDLRSKPSDLVALVGHMKDFLEPADRAHLKSWFDSESRKKSIQKLFPTLKSSRRTLATGYYLRDSEHLVGEVGVSSPSRWHVNDPMASSIISLVGNESRQGSLISSTRLGERLESGFVGMDEKEFGKTEKTVDKVRDEVREERYEEELRYAQFPDGLEARVNWTCEDYRVGSLVEKSRRQERVIQNEAVGRELASEMEDMAKEEFENVEKMVDEERKKMREEYEARQYYELQMAYLEEGIMMD